MRVFYPVLSQQLSWNFLFFLSLFLYFERERESVSVRGEVQGERESQAGSMLPTQSPRWGLNPCTLRL